MPEFGRFLKVITDALPSMISYWDKDLTCRFANKCYFDWLGKPPEAIIGMSMRTLMGDERFARAAPYREGVLAGDKQQFESTIPRADGTHIHIWGTYTPDVDAEGRVIGFFVLLTDVTPMKLAESELKLAASVYQSMAESVFVTDADGLILMVNQAFTDITGYSPEDVLGKTPGILRSKRHDDEFYQTLWNDIKTVGYWRGEVWNRRKDGTFFFASERIRLVRSEGDAPRRYVSVMSDITHTWRNEERMKFLAYHDPLTELPNRALLVERLDHLLAATARAPHQVAVLFIDLNRFKAVNDTLGHKIGDRLLQAIAGKLLTLIRRSDTVARLGGDEFVILLDNPNSEAEVTHVAERVIQAVTEPVMIDGGKLHVGASIGIAMHPFHGNASNELIDNADLAMYAAKKSGDRSYCFFRPGEMTSRC